MTCPSSVHRLQRVPALEVAGRESHVARGGRAQVPRQPHHRAEPRTVLRVLPDDVHALHRRRRRPGQHLRETLQRAAALRSQLTAEGAPHPPQPEQRPAQQLRGRGLPAAQGGHAVRAGVQARPHLPRRRCQLLRPFQGGPVNSVCTTDLNELWYSRPFQGGPVTSVCTTDLNELWYSRPFQGGPVTSVCTTDLNELWFSRPLQGGLVNSVSCMY